MAQPRQRLADERLGGHLREVGVDDLSRQSDVAADLYQARVRRGVDLAVVADELRIHYEQLLALEEGRFDDLPGPTYVIGFLRSYAGYLELDADDLVRRFKDETAFRDSRPNLSFPSPQDEGRVPTSALIALSLALVAAAYGGWYYVANVDRVVVEQVPPVPENVVVPEIMIVEAQPEPVPEPEPEPVAQAVPPAVEPETAVVAVAEEIPKTVAATPEPTAETIEVKAVVVAEPEPAASEVVIVEPVETEAPEPEIGEAISAHPEPRETAPEEIVSAIPDAPVIDTDAYVPREFGMANVGSTIRLRAQLESWIQVTGADNELLVTRILRPGDIYHVPDRPNLVLMTGNAGGIEILVGDQVAPSLGAVGAIQRRVELDPVKLLAGTAAN